MSRKNIVKRDGLTGYRKPTSSEITDMSLFMNKEIKLGHTVDNIFYIAFLVLAITVVINTVMTLTSSGIFLIVVRLLVAVLLMLAAMYFKKVQQPEKIVLSNMNSGNFEVLDCFVYKAELDLNATNTAVVKICHDNDYCSEWFSVNTNSMKKWQEDNTYPFTLLRVEDDKGKYKYEVFSENKIEERLKK